MADGGGVYFPVRAGFCRDRAARLVVRRHGMAGLGRFLALCCMLLDEPGNALSVESPEGMEDVADELMVESAEECGEFLSDLASVGLLDPSLLSDGIVSAPRVTMAISSYESALERARETGRMGGIKSGEARRRKAAERRALEGGLEGAFTNGEGGLEGALNHK